MFVYVRPVSDGVLFMFLYTLIVLDGAIKNGGDSNGV
jgi:hypothetical protein